MAKQMLEECKGAVELAPGFLSLKERLESIKEQFYIDKGTYTNLIRQHLQKQKEIQETERYKEVLDKARLLLLETGNYQRNKVIKDLEEIVTHALQFIMQQEIYFEVDSDPLRGRTECSFYVRTVRNGISNRNPVLNSRGDGISDIVSLALDVANYVLSKSVGPLMLDEPAKQLSGDFSDGFAKQLSTNYLIRVGQFLKEVSRSLNIQIFLITHNEDLKHIGDYKITMYLDGNISRYEEQIAV